MKENNKGYSFVELIITMAIFSIIMLAIILMMRTSLASYKDGLFETTMQEEAQIAANQVSDLLIDASYIRSWSDAAGSEVYDFVGPEGGFKLSHETIVDGDGNYLGGKLWYTSDGGEKQLLSDQMKTFYISGLAKRAADDQSTIYDNAVTVNVGIEYQDRTYSASKDVYFRNNIENSSTDADSFDPFDVVNGPINISNPVDPSTDSEKILRYHPLDISAQYDIIADAVLYENDIALAEGGEGSYFVLKKYDDNGTTHMINESNLPSGVTKAYHYVIEASTVATNNFATFSPTGGNAQKYYVKGKNSKGNEVKVILQLEAVHVGPATGKGVFTAKSYQGDVGDNGYASPVAVTGIHINDAIQTYHIPVTFTATLKSGGSDVETYTNKTVSGINAAYAKDVGKNHAGQSPDDGSGWPLAIVPDPVLGGLLISQDNGEGADMAGSHDYAFLADSSKKNELEFTLNIGGNTTNKAIYYFVFTGMPLDKYN